MGQIDTLIGQRVLPVGTPTDGQALVWDAGSSEWVPTSLSLSYTGELFYDEFTSDVAVSTSITDVVSSGAQTYDGSEVMIEFFAVEYVGPANSAGELILHLYDNTTDLGIIGRTGFTSWGSGNITPAFGPIVAKRKLTPTAASHTYKVRAVTGSSNGTIKAGAGGASTNMPGYIRITKAA